MSRKKEGVYDVSLRIKSEQRDRLAVIGAREERSISYLVRLAVDEFLARRKKNQQRKTSSR